VGVGKTTEFRRWARGLEGEATVVLVRFAGAPPDEAAFLKGLIEAARPVLKAVDRKVWQTADGYLNPSQRRPGDSRRRPLPQVSVEKVLRDLVRVSPPMLFLVDGLDLVEMGRAATLFGPGTFLCGDLLPSIVYSAPHSLLTLRAEARDPRFGQAWHLPAFPVVNAFGNQNDEVVAHLAAGLSYRLPDIDLVGEPGLLAQIAFHSGGIPRHAVTILRGALLATNGNEPISDHHVFQGERELRQDLEQALTPNDLRALKKANAAPRTFAGSRELVVSSAVVPYEGPDHRYWMPHPLLVPLLHEARW